MAVMWDSFCECLHFLQDEHKGTINFVISTHFKSQHEGVSAPSMNKLPVSEGTLNVRYHPATVFFQQDTTKLHLYYNSVALL